MSCAASPPTTPPSSSTERGAGFSRAGEVPIARVMTIDSKAETDAAIAKVEALLSHAKPVPLTDQVRFDLKEAQGLIVELREALERERRWS